MYDDTPALFVSKQKATDVRDYMDRRPDVTVATVWRSIQRGAIVGFRVHCTDKDGNGFHVSNDMVDRIDQVK